MLTQVYGMCELSAYKANIHRSRRVNQILANLFKMDNREKLVLIINSASLQKRDTQVKYLKITSVNVLGYFAPLLWSTLQYYCSLTQ